MSMIVNISTQNQTAEKNDQQKPITFQNSKTGGCWGLWCSRPRLPRLFFSNLSMTLCSNTNQFLLITHWNIGMGIGMGNHDGIILRLLILRICGIHPVVHTGAFLWAIAAILSQTIHLWGRFIFGSSDGYWDISSSFWDNKHSHLDRLWEVW